MADEFILNAAGVEALRQELKELRTTGRADIAEKIKEAKSFGDLSENSEYDEAKSDQGKLEARIAEIEYMLAHVRIVDESSLTTDVVHVGSKVVVYDQEFDTEEEYQIVGFAQADPIEGRISDDSPVGKALLGHREGDVIEVETPGGVAVYKVVSISR